MQAKQKEPREELLTEFWAKVYNPPQDLDTIDRLCSLIRDMRFTSLDMLSSAGGTRVVSRWGVNGFDNGVLGTSPTGRPIRFSGIAVWELRDGKLAHNWVERSAYELSQKLAESPK